MRTQEGLCPRPGHRPFASATDDQHPDHSAVAEPHLLRGTGISHERLYGKCLPRRQIGRCHRAGGAQGQETPRSRASASISSPQRRCGGPRRRQHRGRSQSWPTSLRWPASQRRNVRRVCACSAASRTGEQEPDAPPPCTLPTLADACRRLPTLAACSPHAGRCPPRVCHAFATSLPTLADACRCSSLAHHTLADARHALATRLPRVCHALAGARRRLPALADAHHALTTRSTKIHTG